MQPGFQLESRGRFAVFAADIAPGERRLFSTLIAVRGPSLELLPAPVRNLTGLRTSADGKSAVCFATALGANTLALVAAPLGHGRGQPLALHGPMAPGEYVEDFVVAPDGTKIVYQLSQPALQREELRVVPSAGGPSLLLAADVSYPLAIEPTSTRVLFEEFDAGLLRLVSAPLDGSAPPVTADGRSVVYRARADSVHLALFQASLEAPGNVRRLSGVGSVPYPRTGTTFGLTPDGQRVVFKLDQETRGVDELFLNFLARPAEVAGTPTRSVTVRR